MPAWVVVGRHGGSDVGVVGAGLHGTVVDGTPLVVVDGQGGSVVVVAPNIVVVVPPADVVGGVVMAGGTVVVAPGVAGPEHPKERNSDVKIPVTAGKPEKAACSDVNSWQIGPRIDGSSWARVT